MKENRTGILNTPQIDTQCFLVNSGIVQNDWKLDSSLAFYLAIFYFSDFEKCSLSDRIIQKMWYLIGFQSFLKLVLF